LKPRRTLAHFIEVPLSQLLIAGRDFSPWSFLFPPGFQPWPIAMTEGIDKVQLLNTRR